MYRRTRLSATDVARSFTEILDRVASGEEIEITRADTTVAVFAPRSIRLLGAAAFREVLETAPPVDRDFAHDVHLLRAEVGGAPRTYRPCD